MVEPRFKVGDFVVSKAQAEALRLSPKHYSRPITFQVTDIIVQVCYATAQIFYFCRGASYEGVNNDLVKFVEIELDPTPTEPEKE